MPLDACCALSPPAAYVNEFDGSVGTVSKSLARREEFSNPPVVHHSGALRIDNTGIGMAAGLIKAQP